MSFFKKKHCLSFWVRIYLYLYHVWDIWVFKVWKFSKDVFVFTMAWKRGVKVVRDMAKGGRRTNWRSRRQVTNQREGLFTGMKNFSQSFYHKDWFFTGMKRLFIDIFPKLSQSSYQRDVVFTGTKKLFTDNLTKFLPIRSLDQEKIILIHYFYFNSRK